MLINLLANACEHTPMGTTIRVASEATSECVLLSISDDGTGIPPEQLEHIFQPFHRINLSHPGSGLGLAIARRIAELHGGDIWAENRLDGTNAHGTTFSVTLPIRTVEDAQCL
jgi:signal transduction histidine kinase